MTAEENLWAASTRAHEPAIGQTNGEQTSRSLSSDRPAPAPRAQEVLEATAEDAGASRASRIEAVLDAVESRAGLGDANRSGSALRASAQAHRSRHARALSWFEFGYDVIPVAPGTKQTAVRWGPWLQKLSTQALAAHWARWPDHDIGFIVGDAYIVFDADGPASVAALESIEARFGVAPSLVVKTPKGWHHHFRRAAGICARSDSHDSERHPDRIDVKTGQALVVLPPSGGRAIVSKGDAIGPAANAADLAVVGQDFIDAVFAHNGRPPPRPAAPGSAPGAQTGSVQIRLLRAVLKRLDADCGYDDWLRVGAAVFHETGGGDEGFDLFHAWSRTGRRKYKGSKDVRIRWKSFRLDHPRPATMATLRRMLSATGQDWLEVCASAEADFEIVGEQNQGGA